MFELMEGMEIWVDEKAPFKVMKRVGEGTLGEVWQIQDRQGEMYALKIIRVPDETDAYAQEFIKKIEILHTIEHLHILPILHYGLLPFEGRKPSIVGNRWKTDKQVGMPFLITAYSERSLADYILEENRDPMEELDYALQLCLGLNKIHSYYIPGSRGLEPFFHGNLKPSNVFFFKKGKKQIVKISDLGLSGLGVSVFPSFQTDIADLAPILRQVISSPSPRIGQWIEEIGKKRHSNNVLGKLIKAIWDERNTLHKKRMARTLCLLGMNLYQKGSHDYALKDFQKAISLDPELFDAFLYQGDVLKEMERYEEAFASYEKALQLKNDAAIVYENRAEIHAEKKCYPEAIADFQKAITLDPESSSAHGGLGMVYFMLEEYQKALEQFERLISIVSDFAPAYVDRGNVLLKLEQTEKAIESYRFALELNEKAEEKTIDPEEIRQKIALAQEKGKSCSTPPQDVLQ